MPQLQPVKVFLADRHPHFRENIRNIFRKKDIEISGEADTADEMIDQLGLQQTELLITAHTLHDEGADYFLPIIKEKFPNIKILMLTLNCNKKVFLRYVNFLDGMLCKLAGREEIIEAVFEIAKKNKLYFRVDISKDEAKGYPLNGRHG